jgi:hypothetical protein
MNGYVLGANKIGKFDVPGVNLASLCEQMTFLYTG